MTSTSLIGNLVQVALDTYLAQAVAHYETRMYQHLLPKAEPRLQPYKFLYPFEIDDTDIFFGRITAVEQIYRTLLKDRLAVLHARSGAGKTSLLQAGLGPKLIKEGRIPIYARVYEDPLLAIKRAIAPPSQDIWPKMLHSLTLQEFLGRACRFLSKRVQELVVILDQFEEFFIFHQFEEHRQPFIKELAECYNDSTLQVRFILALRKDYYSDLAEFQPRIPTILYNEVRLGEVTYDEAIAAITGPVARLGPSIAYEDSLLNELLADLQHGGMELPHLQIICTQLFHGLNQNETLITLTAYDRMGRAEGILGGYLRSVLERLPGNGASIAREVLKELTSSEITKRVLSFEMLVSRLATDPNELEELLNRLVDARLLRSDEIAGEVVYELAHEYLLNEIQTWLDPKDSEYKRAEELLIREVANWHAHGTFLPKERLSILYKHRNKFKIENETWRFLLSSAIEANSDIEGWSNLVSAAGEDILVAALMDSRFDVRLAIVSSLGRIWNQSAVVSLGDKNADKRKTSLEEVVRLDNSHILDLLRVSLQDENEEVRKKTVQVLSHLGGIALPLLSFALNDKNVEVRIVVIKVLDDLDDINAVNFLAKALKDEDPQVRRLAARALRKTGLASAVEPLSEALKDIDPQVRNIAYRALQWVDTPESREIRRRYRRKGGVPGIHYET